MRKLTLAFLFSLFVTCGVQAAEVNQFDSKLDEIKDVKLQVTLKNSIEAGLIENDKDFDDAVARFEKSMNSNSTVFYSAYEKDDKTTRRKKGKKNGKKNGYKPNKPSNNGNGGNSNGGGALSQKIESLVAPIKKLDKDAVKVVEIEKNGSSRLFEDISGKIPASYKATVELSRKFNPKTNTSETKHNKAIMAYFESIKNDPCIQYALTTTNTTIEDMKNNWFGAGAGFEHVIAGEIKGSKVSGYHWWYKYYADEREGYCELNSQMDGIGDQAIFTGSFMYDPDKNGPLPNCRKPKGGFTNGNSANALLAMGHIAIETARQLGSIPGAFKFKADISGNTYVWQVYTMNGTLRSLYPMTMK